MAGREADYEEWAHHAASASARYGATAHTFLTPDRAVPTRRVLIAQFPHADAVKAWDDSEERSRLVQEAEEFSRLHLQRASGIETWFALPGRLAARPASTLEATPRNARRRLSARRSDVWLGTPAPCDVAAAAAVNRAPRRAAHPDDLRGHAVGDKHSPRLAVSGAKRCGVADGLHDGLESRFLLPSVANT